VVNTLGFYASTMAIHRLNLEACIMTAIQEKQQVSPNPATVFGPTGYFNDDAGLGIVGRGHSPEAACVAAAEALFALIVDPSAAQTFGAVAVQIAPRSNDELLFTWLTRLQDEARRAGIALSSFDLQRQSEGWIGSAHLARKRIGQDHGLDVGSILPESCSLQPAEQGWEARCVVTVTVRDVSD
jgi:SHS2 domain-containing protein